MLRINLFSLLRHRGLLLRSRPSASEYLEETDKCILNNYISISWK